MFSTFVTVMLVATLILLVVTRAAAETIARHHYRQRVDFFRHYTVRPGDIVFLGDSITDGACWDEVFPGLPIKNRGINADTTQGVLQRLGEILDYRPSAIFVLIGTNDLPWYMYRTNRGILKTYDAILTRCRNESPDTKVFVQSIFPRHPRYARRIQSINTHLKALAELHGCTYIDVFPHLVDPRGGLRRALTNDGLHLMAQGYVIWASVLRQFLFGSGGNIDC